MLANRGYDVWVGNSRGNRYSSNHTTLDPQKHSEFWEFSFQHMVQFDLPAELTYVAKFTGKKIHYIGHSQGTTQMFAALSLNVTGVRKHLHEFIALAPVTFLEHASHVQKLADPLLIFAVDFLKIDEFFSEDWQNKKLAAAYCLFNKRVCDGLLSGTIGWDDTMDNSQRSDVIATHLPTSTSATNLLHWRQLIVSNGSFVQLDYRSAKLNKKHYGTVIPPEFPLEKIDPSLEIHLFVGFVDGLADPADAGYLAHKLDHLKTLKIWYYFMGHGTFILGLDMSYLYDVYNIIESKT